MTRLLLRIMAASWCRQCGDVGLARRLQVGQHRQDGAQLRALAARRQAGLDARVERDQADRVLLVDHQVAQGRRQADGVLELGQLLPVGVGHRARSGPSPGSR